MAEDTHNTKLLAKLSAGDMHAQDAVYHKQCMTNIYNLYNRAVQEKGELHHSTDNIDPESKALAEVVSFIEESRHHDVKTFQLSELTKLYKQSFTDITGNIPYVHPTRLKERLKVQMPDLEDHMAKSGIILTFKEYIGDALLSTRQKNNDKAVIVMRAAEILRKDVLHMSYDFKGSLVDMENDTYPQTLIRLLNKVMGRDESYRENFAKLISQLIVFNAMKRKWHKQKMLHCQDTT